MSLPTSGFWKLFVSYDGNTALFRLLRACAVTPNLCGMTSNTGYAMAEFVRITETTEGSVRDAKSRLDHMHKVSSSLGVVQVADILQLL